MICCAKDESKKYYVTKVNRQKYYFNVILALFMRTHGRNKGKLQTLSNVILKPRRTA